MHRLIKFRCWDEEEKVMYEWNPYFFYDDSPVTDFSGKFPDESDAKIIMQFTGLHDKNGKEIYEGDIVKDYNNNIVGQVGYTVPNFELYDSDGDDYGLYPMSVNEVIGNIYENPELLK